MEENKPIYYDGTKLLSLTDLDGRKPELFLCTTNRTGGKTTWFSRMLVNRRIRKANKFMLLYRFNYELDNVSDKFFKDIQGLFFPDYIMEDQSMSRGIYHTLYLRKRSAVLAEDPLDESDVCGYAVALNNADAVKKYSHLFSDVDCIFFDEFQSETNHYCSDEVKKFISIHTTVARGQGKQVRYVPVYMCGNTVSMINPYYTELGISERLRKDTNFLRGHGFVLENGFIETASRAQKESGFNRAFSNNKYVAYAAENVYLDDSMSFIEKPRGKSKYLATLGYNGNDYSLRSYDEQGIIYCDNKDDETFKFRIAVTTADHRINYVMLRSNDMFVQQMRYYFERGCFRFKSLNCKEAVMKLISY